MIKLENLGSVLESTLQNFLGEIWQFQSASSRFYFPYLLSSLIILGLWAKKKNIPILKTLRGLLFDRSFQTDLSLFLFNGLLKVTVFSSIILLNTTIAWQLQSVASDLFIGLRGILKGSIIGGAFFTLFAFLLDDFLRFFVHMTMHKVPFLWKLHRTHHTATRLNPLTLYRAHPLEVFIASFRNALSGGIIAGLAIFLFGVRGLDVITTVAGVNILGFIFNLSLSNLRHSPVPIRFGFFERFFISPYMHQIHHSKNEAHFNKNYGTCFTVWDSLCGSLLRPKKTEDLKFGC